MSNKTIQLNEDLIKHDLKDFVRNSVEETLNALLDKEADELVNAEKYERCIFHSCSTTCTSILSQSHGR